MLPLKAYPYCKSQTLLVFGSVVSPHPAALHPELRPIPTPQCRQNSEIPIFVQITPEKENLTSFSIIEEHLTMRSGRVLAPVNDAFFFLLVNM